VFRLDSLVFGMFGGPAVAIDLAKAVPTYTIRTLVAGLDVNRALAATTTLNGLLLGTASVSGTVNGSVSAADAVEQTLRGNLTFV
jgi:hypothetical protein